MIYIENLGESIMGDSESTEWTWIYQNWNKNQWQSIKLSPWKWETVYSSQTEMNWLKNTPNKHKFYMDAFYPPLSF